MSEEDVVPECEVVEPVPERKVVESVAENMLAGEGRADKAVSTGDEHAPAGDHAATETAATEPTVEAAAVHATAALCHGWRCHDDCRRHRGRGEATEQFGLHDTDPS